MGRFRQVGTKFYVSGIASIFPRFESSFFQLCFGVFQNAVRSPGVNRPNVLGQLTSLAMAMRLPGHGCADAFAIIAHFSSNQRELFPAPVARCTSKIGSRRSRLASWMTAFGRDAQGLPLALCRRSLVIWRKVLVHIEAQNLFKNTVACPRIGNERGRRHDI